MILFITNIKVLQSLRSSLLLSIFITAFQPTCPQNQIRVADYYFDGINGNDSNNGLTPLTAKKTLNALNNLGSSIQNKIIALRDSIIYRRSSSGYAAVRIDYNNVTLTNWYEGGSDKLPRILGSNAKLTNWNNVSGNIWQSTTAVGNNTVYFEFADSIRWGIIKYSQDELLKEFDFYISSGTVYCYSPTDPDIRYLAVETFNRDYCISLFGDGITVEYLQLDYGGIGVAIESVSNNNLIQNCKINFHGTSSGVMSSCCGEGIQLWSSNNIIRGNYIQEASSHGIHIYTLSGDISNNLVEYNVVWNCHHTGYDVNSGSGLNSNINIRYNIYYDTPWAAERQEPGYSGQASGFFCNGNVSNITLAYNLFYNCYQSTCAQIAEGDSIYVYNNTFANTINYGGSGYGAIFGNSNTVAKNNIFVTNGRTTTNGSFLVESNNLVYNYSNGGTGVIEGLNSNPQFIDRFNFNFRLLPNSQAINLGTNLGYSEDLDGNPILGNPDAGAYETMNIGNGSYIMVHPGWNFLSIPRLSTNMSVDFLLPTRNSLVYEFTLNGYQAVTSLQNGIGYIAKFSDTQYIFITGESVSFPIELSEGWNLIGPFDEDVPLSQIYSIPSGIIISNFYGFEDGNYTTTDVLRTGKGYWIKVSSDGIINLNSEVLTKVEDK
jgi:hypothetical protein